MSQLFEQVKNIVRVDALIKYGVGMETKEDFRIGNQIDDILEYASFKGEDVLIEEFGLIKEYAEHLLNETIKKLNDANVNYVIEGIEGIFTPEEFKGINRDFIRENYQKFTELAQ